MVPQHVLPAQPSVQDTFSAQAGMHDHLPYGQFTGTQFVPGIKPISPPFFNDCSQATQRSAKEKILDYRDRVKASNFKHGTTSKPLEVIFMMKRELASSMITQMLAPGTAYDSHSLFQQQLIDRWFMSEDSIYGVPQDIRIHEFNSRMSKISMNAQNPSWFDRLRAFFESVDKCIVQCRVQVNDKSLIIKMMKGVNPPRLRKRIAGLLSSGDPAQQSCRTNVSLWKDLLRQETQIEHSAQLTLALANSPYSEDNRQRTRRSQIGNSSTAASRINSRRKRPVRFTSTSTRSRANNSSKDTRSFRRAFTKRPSNKPRHAPTHTKKQETRQCHNCGKTGHLKRDCRAASRPSNSSRPSSTRPSHTPSKWRRPQTAREAMQYPEVIYQLETAKAVRPEFYEHDDDCPLRAGLCFTHCMCCNPAPTGPVINHGILYPISLPVPLPELRLAPPAMSPPPLVRTNTIRPRRGLSAAAAAFSPGLCLTPPPTPPSPTLSELCVSSPESVDSLAWAYDILAQEASPASSHPEKVMAVRRVPLPPSPQYDPATGTTVVLPPSPQYDPTTGTTAALPMAAIEPVPLHMPPSTLPSPSSTNIMLQLLGGPTVQPPSKRAPTVCNLISRFPSVDGRRGIKGKEVWRARLRRNGILNTIGKGFESELEAVICVQKYLLVELEQVYSAIQSPLVPYTNLTAPSATDPSAKAKAHDNQAAQSVREVLPSAGSPFLYLPALRTGKQEAEDLVSHLVESQG